MMLNFLILNLSVEAVDVAENIFKKEKVNETEAIDYGFIIYQENVRVAFIQND